MILQPPGCRRIRLRHVCPMVLCLSTGTVLATPTEMADAEFQASFLYLSPGQPRANAAHALHALSEQQELPPGRYPVQVLVNLSPAGVHELAFEPAPGDSQLQACLPPGLLAELGLRLDAIADPTAVAGACLDLPSLVPGALVAFDASQLQLAISIPQIALRRDLAGQVDPQRWENGIAAAFVSYQASMQQSDSRGRGNQNSQDLYLNSGINLAGWRLRSNQAWRRDDQGQQTWDRSYTYAQHDLPGTWGNITLGETFTSSDVFRGVPVTGVRLASDFDMLPDGMRSYAPTLRGVAQTRAKLEVWQNGYPIYSTYVSPGPYAIDDLNVGATGELEVVLTEADGQVRRFIQPYASITNLLRPGVMRYSTTLGRYNPASSHQAPLLWQGTMAMGMVWNATLYGGLMASEGYTAEAMGIARDLGAIGALSFDITHARSDLSPVEPRIAQGMSYSARYSKAFNSGTHLRFAGYRYSTQGYRDFDEWISQRSSDRLFLGSRRSRVEGSINQRVGDRSTLSLTLSQQDYWQRNDSQRQFQLNFSTSHNGVSYSLYGSQSLTHNSAGNDRQFGLSVSVPLEFGRSSSLSLDLQHSAHGTSQRAALHSQADRLSYNASVAASEQQQQSAALSLAYGNQYNASTSGFGYKQQQQGLSFGADGRLPVGDGNWLAGVTAGYSNSDLNLQGGSTGSVDSYHIGAYTTWLDPQSGYYFDGVAKFNRYQNRADVQLSDGSKTKGDYSNHGIGVSLEAGRHIKLDQGYFLEPYAQLAAMTIEGQSYHLANGMQASGDDTRSLQGKLGATAGRTFDFGQGRMVQPYVRVAGAHEFANNNRVKVNGNSLDNDLAGSRAELGAGVVAAWADNWQVHAEFDYANGERLEQPWGASVGVRYNW